MFKIISNSKLSWFFDTITKLHGIIEQNNRLIKRQAETINHLIASAEQQEQIIRQQADEVHRLKTPPYMLTVEVDREELINGIKRAIQESVETVSDTDKTPNRDSKGMFAKKN